MKLLGILRVLAFHDLPPLVVLAVQSFNPSSTTLNSGSIILDKTSKIYIAGHKGLVGSAILRKLQSKGYTNLVTRSHQELDLMRQTEVEDFFSSERPEYVFLAAAKVGGILANNTYPAQFIYDNIMIQSNIIHAAYSHSVKKLLFLGSSCIYPRDCPQPMKEHYLLSGKLEPTNEPYAIAKIAGIKLCQSYNRQYGTHFFSVMPTNLYGPNDNYDLETSHVLSALLRKFHLGKLASLRDWEGIKKDESLYGPIPEGFRSSLGLRNFSNTTNSTSQPVVAIWGTGSPRREFLHVDDMADACIFLMHLETAHHLPLINIGCGKDNTIRDLAELVSIVVGFRGKLEWDRAKPDGMPQKLLDVTRLTELGWKPKIPLEQGIHLAYQDYLDKTQPQV
jgi:GDP-L-fucose synthase